LRLFCVRNLSSNNSVTPIETETTTTSSNPVTVHSSLGSSNGPIDYARGWAWQQTLLNQRLEHRRRSVDNDDSSDTILLLEHSPVYTLGRGANEHHLTSLGHDGKVRLARSCRGPGSARLSMDKLDPALLVMTTSESVEQLSTMATPVMFALPTDDEGSSHTRCDAEVPIYRIERGGEVTHHGPGQLVVYPLLDLSRPPLEQDLHWYLRQVEQVVIDTLLEYDIATVRDDINTGVWFDKCKVAAVGVSSSRWITTHGFALNVSPNLQYFDTSYILPCGIEGRGVTSIEKIMHNRGETIIPTVADVAATVLTKIESVFGVEIEQQTITSIQ
jgi:lipoyl(octanoyl) transferase